MPSLPEQGKKACRGLKKYTDTALHRHFCGYWSNIFEYVFTNFHGYGFFLFLCLIGINDSCQSKSKAAFLAALIIRFSP